ncbi:MAG: CBS domain-containing protein [Oscillochloris sp.]|nr:CBS domain-containing protein [Oscillochloris sp.]
MFRHAITLGRIATIPIRLHWSWALIFGMLVFALRPVYTPLVCGEVACGRDLVLAVLLALLVGVSVLLHELGHALVAQRMKLDVHAITLFAFGGVAEVNDDAAEPGAELAIAVAGPLVSLLLAAGGGIVAWLADPTFALLAGHLAAANAVMAIFNLLPGYPMDGGRVLRAVLWFFNDDLIPATRIAAQIGRLTGIAMGLLGLVLGLLYGQAIAGAWSLLIGVFLFHTANTSFRHALLHSALHGVVVGDVMQRRFRTVSCDLTLEQFVARYVLGQVETGFAVVHPSVQSEDEPPLLGMMTLRHLRHFRSDVWSLHRIEAVMTPATAVTPLDPRMTAIDALQRLEHTADGVLPVTKDSRLVGMLRRRDLAVYIQVQMARRNRR